MYYKHINEVDAAHTGVDGASLADTNASEWIDVNGASEVVLEFDVVDDSAAALPVVFYVDSQRAEDDASTTRYETSISDAVVATEMVGSLYRHKYVFTTAAAKSTQRFTVALTPHHQRIKVTGITAAGAAATDLISMHARVVFNP